MARDFLALQDECLQYGYGARERDFFKTWLNEANYDVATRHEWRWLDDQVTVATSALNPTVAAPVATIMFPKRMRPTLNTTPEPRYVAWNSYEDGFHRSGDDGARGVPTIYTFYDNQFRFHPTPDAVYNYTTICQMVPTEMVDNTDEPWMPTEHRGVLVSGAMVKMSARDKDFQAVQHWSDQYEGQIAKMRMANSKVDAGRPHKVAMPRHYGWGN
jgi:hypothetical protein